MVSMALPRFLQRIAQIFSSRDNDAASVSDACASRASAGPNVAQTPADPEWLIIGLGNPGAKYQLTPHNVGYFAIDHALDHADDYAPGQGPQPSGTQLSLQPVPGCTAHAAVTTWGENTVALVRSDTYMNESGVAVAALAQHWSIPPERVIVIHDELDLPPGTVKLKAGGSDNGHNGLKSITAQLGSGAYARVRMGIGRPAGVPIIEHVIGPMTQEILDTLPTQSADAIVAAQLIITEGVDRAQNIVHTRKR